jgi:hypothetical protein
MSSHHHCEAIMKKGLGKRDERNGKIWLRRLAYSIASQLPDSPRDALYVLEMAQEIIEEERDLIASEPPIRLACVSQG